MTSVDLIVAPPSGHAYNVAAFRLQIGQQVAVLVADEGVEQATLLDANIAAGGGVWDVRLTFDLSPSLAARHTAGEVRVTPQITRSGEIEQWPQL